MRQRLKALGLMGALLLWTTLDAGHTPGPPPAPPKDKTKSSSDLSTKNKAEGIFGPKELYPVLDGMQLMPLERLSDLSKLKYEDGSVKWCWEWEESKEGNYMLPAETMALSTEVIKLSKEVFKKFKEEDIASFVKAGPPILPLLMEELRLPEYPVGLGDLDAQGRKGAASDSNNRKKVRGQAFEILQKIPGSIADPYRYAGLIDTDSGIRLKALEGFGVAKREPSLGALLLLWAHDTSTELEGLIKPLMEKEVPGSFAKAEALRKLTSKELLKQLKDSQLSGSCLAVGLERLEIPSFRGDDSKAERKKAEAELKLIEDSLAPHLAKWVGKGAYEAPEGKAREAGVHEILLWGACLKLGKAEVFARLEEANRDSRWWVRLLVSRALSDAWEQRKDATPKLLERQRDWFYVVRREANRSLRALHRLSVPFEAQPALPSDSFVIDQWEKWALGREGLKGLDDPSGWTSLTLKAEEGNVYSPTGPSRHKYLTGKMGAVQLTLIDHNGNDRYDDFGIDNFSVGALDKPGTFLSQLARIDGKYHYLKFNPKTFELKIKAYDGPLGRLKVKESYAKNMALEFLVIGKSADVTIQVERDAKTKTVELEVPAGHYNIYAGNVQRGGKKGNDVYIAHIGTGGNRFFDVPVKGEVEITLGEPLHFDAEIDFTAGKNDKPVVRVRNPNVMGSFDELYFSIQPEYSKLEVKFLAPSGKLIKSFDWRLKTEVSKSGADLLADTERDRYIEQLQVELIANQTFYDNYIKTNFTDQGLPLPNPPDATMSASLSNIALAQQYLATARIKFYGSAITTFPPILFALEQLPEEYDIEISGEVFFGKVEPLKIRIKGDKRTAENTAPAPSVSKDGSFKP